MKSRRLVAFTVIAFVLGAIVAFSFAYGETAYAFSVNEVEFPDFGTVEYDTGVCLNELVAVTESITRDGDKYVSENGYFLWANGNAIPSVYNEGYEIYFYPTDGNDYSSVSGWDGERVIRVIGITVTKAHVTPTPLYENQENYIECAVGMLIKNIELPTGWCFCENVDVNEPLTGTIDDMLTFDVVYKPYDGNPNYETVNDVLNVKLVQPKARFINSVENSQQPTLIPVEVETDDDNNVTATVEQLVNTFTRTGYSLKGWELSDGTFISYGSEEGQYKLGEAYTIPSLELVKNIIEIKVVWAPNTDTQVTVIVYKENTEGEYTSKISMLDNTRKGVTDEMFSVDENTVTIGEGFKFDYAKSGGKIGSEFKVKADGSTIINIYLKRKTYVLNFDAGEYSSFAPGGTLPESITVRYEQSIDLPKTTDFKVYGYHNAGWTDGVTYSSDEKLKVFANKYTVRTDEREEYTLSVVLEGNLNTEYVVREYFDGEQRVSYRTAKTGTEVSVGGGPVGYTAESRDGEKLTGTVTGHEKNEDGEVIAGERLELIVYYKSRNYVLTFSDSEVATRTDVKYGEEIVLEEPPARDNYEFMHWLINGVIYETGSTFTMPATNVSIRAVWKSTLTEEKPLGTLIEPSEEKGLSGWAIAGIVIGSVAVIAGTVVVIFFLVKRKSRKK